MKSALTARFVAVVGSCCSAIIECNAQAPREQVVLDRFAKIADGGSEWHNVPAGSYRLHMTATSDGASVTWVGAACPGSPKSTVFDVDCTMPQDGQLEIGNPSLLGLGKTIAVTVKLTRL
jgi:hypothetical protein